MKYLFIFLLLVTCKSTISFEKIIQEKQFNYSIFPNTADKPFFEKIGVVPNDVLDYWYYWDKISFNVEKYNKYLLNENQSNIMKNTLKKMPAYIVNSINSNFLGFFPVENLYGNGIAEFVVAPTNQLKFYILFDPTILI